MNLENYDKTSSVIREIIKMFGIDIVYDYNKFYGIVCDKLYGLDNNSARNLLAKGIKSGIYADIYKNIDNCDIAARRNIQRLINNEFLDEKFAVYIVNVFLVAIDKEPIILMNEKLKKDEKIVKINRSIESNSANSNKKDNSSNLINSTETKQQRAINIDLEVENRKQKEYEEEQLQIAVNKYVNKEYEKAFSIFMTFSEVNSMAMYYLFLCYENGYGVSCDKNESWKWLEKAALNGHVEAQYQYGKELVLATFGSIENYKIGVDWMKIAADQGHSNAAFQVGYIYCFGTRIKKDYEIGFKYLEIAARQNDKIASVYLAHCYMDGYGIDKNPKKAFALYEDAAKYNVSLAKYYLGECYFDNFSSKGVEKNDEKALYWFHEFIHSFSDLTKKKFKKA